MKKRWIRLAVAAAVSLMLAACGGSSNEASQTEAVASGNSDETKYIVFVLAGGKLGDQAEMDNTWSGIQKYVEETGAKSEYFELSEMQDFDNVVRSYCDNGADLVITTSQVSEFVPAVAADYPDVRFALIEGTAQADTDNVLNLRCSVSEGAFAAGAFAALMNEELTGSKEVGFVGGVRNPNLERTQYGFAAGAKYVGGNSTSVYVGNFSDAAKAKELTTQMFSGDTRIVQAWAGGANTGVFEAAESMGEGYYTMGAANGQFEMSDSIIASSVKDIETLIYNTCVWAFGDEWKSGTLDAGLDMDAVGVKYAPDGRDAVIPQEIKDQVEEIKQKIIAGEIVPPSTEEEMAEFEASLQ